MHPKSHKILEDIRDACAFVLQSTSGVSLDQFKEDRLLRQAVERNFEIIGEAINRLARIDESIAEKIGDTRRIIGFRNILIHGYDIVDHEIVWLIIQDNLPDLLQSVKRLL